MRTTEQSIALIDEIIGRCVREAEFADRVLRDPDRALAEYQLEEDEIGDFRALRAKTADEAIVQWTHLRKLHSKHALGG
jgi:hypothetical protein